MWVSILVTLLVLILLGIVLIRLFIIFAPQLGAKADGERAERVHKSPQYKNGIFQNISPVTVQISFRRSLKLIGEMIRGGKNRRPKQTLPSKQPLFDKESGAYLTWFGHSTFLYEVDGKKILFDPMLGKHAAPLPFLVKRYPYTLPSSAKNLPFLDAVIISHDHYDHLDYGTIKILKEKVGRFIMPLGVGAHLERWGVAKEKITELDWWDTTTLGELKIAATPSQHFSGRTFNDRSQTLWASWIVQSSNAKVFFGGDSGYFAGFKKIGEVYGPFDLTLLDSAQYNSRWPVVHMVPEQSVQAHKDLKGKVFMPIHWSAFTLSLHDWNEPPERALIAAEKEGVDIITPIIGERFDVLKDRPKKYWWRDLK
jgi:L-ascorbate metabolism protein UlaG (beta-lactamase superfamily)